MYAFFFFFFFRLIPNINRLMGIGILVCACGGEVAKKKKEGILFLPPSQPCREGFCGGCIHCPLWEAVPVSDCSGQEGLMAVVLGREDASQLSVVASSGALICWFEVIPKYSVPACVRPPYLHIEATHFSHLVALL